MGKLEGKVAIVTGGASGIGEATVRLFVAEGARVLVADMQEDKGQALAAEFGQAAAFHKVNVTREPEVKAAIDAAVARWGRLDCLFNNAGFGGALGPLESISVDEFDMTFDVLVKGVFLGLKHAAPVMKRQRAGNVINTGSVAGLQAGVGPHVYSAAKAAVVQLTKSAALEFAEWGARVNCICPGAVATPLAAGRPDASAEHLDQLRRSMADAHPLGRVGEPEEIARAALWLASDDSGFVTGHALVVDGGMMAGRPWRKQPDLWRTPRPIRMYRLDSE
ncbi:MAG: glucose 1-dehydrogenase [Thermodesulfobacteriota bacterium]|jgi:NAD(P)-dependent dehydrogenase (short-subunit alcohol dehydrogenase family)